MKLPIANHILNRLEQLHAIAEKEGFIAADPIKDAIEDMKTSVELLHQEDAIEQRRAA